MARASFWVASDCFLVNSSQGKRRVRKGSEYFYKTSVPFIESGDFIIAQRQRHFLFDCVLCVLWGMSSTRELWRSMALILTALIRLSCTIFHDFSLNQYYKWNHILTVLDVWLTHAVLGHHILSLLWKTGQHMESFIFLYILIWVCSTFHEFFKQSFIPPDI